jgi:hypothetical protein
LSNGGANNASPIPRSQSGDQNSPSGGSVGRQPGLAASDEWYLSYRAPESVAQSPFQIVSAGFSHLDDIDAPKVRPEDEESGRFEVAGRKRFGNFRKSAGRRKDEDEDDEDEEDDEDDEEGGTRYSDNATGVDALIATGQRAAAERVRAERKAKRKADNAGLHQMGEERRKKEVKLNRLSGISSGGGGGGGPSTSNASNSTCFTCGKKGHMKKDCPKAPNGASRGPRKSY